MTFSPVLQPAQARSNLAYIVVTKKFRSLAKYKTKDEIVTSMDNVSKIVQYFLSTKPEVLKKICKGVKCSEKKQIGKIRRLIVKWFYRS